MDYAGANKKKKPERTSPLRHFYHLNLPNNSF